MEYKTIKKDASEYPEKLIRRLGKDAPERIYYHGPLELLDIFTMGIVSADSITGLALMEANQLLFTIREYDINYIGSAFSVMETEIFRLGLWRSNQDVTLFSSKGLAKESFESFLKTRFYPPFDEFPERDEYFRRAEENELLILSVVDPDIGKMTRKNIVERNFVACMVSDVVFIPFAEKGTKTLSLAKRLVNTEVPVFTTSLSENKALHDLGIPGLTRQNVGEFLEKLGGRRSDPNKERPRRIDSPPQPEQIEPLDPPMIQMSLWEN